MSIPLERCAEMRAEMDGGQLRDELVKESAETPGSWGRPAGR